VPEQKLTREHETDRSENRRPGRGERYHLTTCRPNHSALFHGLFRPIPALSSVPEWSNTESITNHRNHPRRGNEKWRLDHARRILGRRRHVPRPVQIRRLNGRGAAVYAHRPPLQERRHARANGREKVLGGGLEPPCLAAYAPQTYVSAISPPEQIVEPRNFSQPATARKCSLQSTALGRSPADDDAPAPTVAVF
jgi:hypothetical protein